MERKANWLRCKLNGRVNSKIHLFVHSDPLIQNIQRQTVIIISKAYVLIFKIDVNRRRRRRPCIWRHNDIVVAIVLYTVLCCISALYLITIIMWLLFLSLLLHFERTKLIKFVHRRIEDASIELYCSVSVCRFVYTICHRGTRVLTEMCSMHAIPK